jgi:hypothetical protein
MQQHGQPQCCAAGRQAGTTFGWLGQRAAREQLGTLQRQDDHLRGVGVKIRQRSSINIKVEIFNDAFFVPM